MEVIAVVDRDRGSVQINVRPSEGGGFAAAQAGVKQQHGGALGAVGRFADPALLLFGDGLTGFRIGTGGAGGFDDGVILHHFRDSEIINRLGAAAEVGQGEVGHRRLAIVPLGQPVQHRLEVGSTQIGRRTGQQIAPVILLSHSGRGSSD